MNSQGLRVILLALAGLAIGACGQVSDEVDAAVDQQALFSRAKDSVVRDQPDPAAVQFRDIVQSGDMVCGDLNGKNLLGAYVGFKPFVYREFANGQTAWQTTGINAFGIESRYVDGCLFPQANQCHADLLVSRCAPSNRERHLAQGFPADQLGGADGNQLAEALPTLPVARPEDAKPITTDYYQSCLDSAGSVTSDIMDCVTVELARVDEILNDTYQQKMQSKRVDTKSLRESQREWIAARDAKCLEETKEVWGGSQHYVVHDGCLIEQTVERIDWLRGYPFD